MSFRSCRKHSHYIFQKYFHACGYRTKYSKQVLMETFTMDYTRTLKFQQASEETDVQADTETNVTRTITIPEGDEIVKGMSA